MEKCCEPFGTIVADGLVTQFDLSDIATRQCSWFAVSIAASYSEIQNSFQDNNFEGFIQIYSRVLQEATASKATSSTRSEIETLFHPAILQHFQSTKLDLQSFRKVHLNPNLPDEIEIFMNQFPNAEEVKNTKLSFLTSSLEDLRTDLLNLLHQEYNAMVLNRFSESIAIISVNGSFSDESDDNQRSNLLILDSHRRQSALMTVDGAINYLLYDAVDRHLLLIYALIQ
jgi:hypothetical protein